MAKDEPWALEHLLDPDEFLSVEVRAFLLGQGITKAGAIALLSELRLVYVQMLCEALIGLEDAEAFREAFNHRILERAMAKIPELRDQAARDAERLDAEIRRQTLLGRQ